MNSPNRKYEKKMATKVQMIKLLELKVKELDDVFGDMIDDLAADLNLGPMDDADEAENERRYDEYQGLEDEVKEAALRQFGENLMGGTVWGLVSISPHTGVEVEFFSQRPTTADGDPSNWPKWFRVYEGSLNGGDSIITDGLGRSLF